MLPCCCIYNERWSGCRFLFRARAAFCSCHIYIQHYEYTVIDLDFARLTLVVVFVVSKSLPRHIIYFFGHPITNPLRLRVPPIYLRGRPVVPTFVRLWVGFLSRVGSSTPPPARQFFSDVARYSHSRAFRDDRRRRQTNVLSLLSRFEHRTIPSARALFMESPPPVEYHTPYQL